MKHCTTDKCPQILDSSCVFYEGPTLIYSGINTNDSVETVIKKLDIKLELIPGIDLSNYYTKNETDLLLGNYYLKTEIDTLYLNYYKKTETYSQNEIDDFLVLKADLSSLGNYYTKLETFSQAEINNLLNNKQNNLGYTPENVANKSDSYTASSSTTYASTKALVDGLATKLDKGTYTGTAQNLKNDIDGKANISHAHNISSITNLQTALNGKQDKLSSYDESILIENGGNIEGNISLFQEYFEQQECELNFEPIQIVAVYQDGIKLSSSEYEIILPKKIKIKEYVNENIQIEYTHLKS